MKTSGIFAENILKSSEKNSLKNSKKNSLLSALFTREESSLVGGFLGIHAATVAYIPNMYIWAGTGRYRLGQDTLSYQRTTKMQTSSGIAVEQELQFLQSLWVNSQQGCFALCGV